MSTTITANMIQELRSRTGIGMAKCKIALQKANGDMDLAIANLRKEGLAAAVKKESREAKEGLIAYAQSEKQIAFVEVTAETDFVLRNNMFVEFSQNIAQEVLQHPGLDLQSFMQQPFSKDPSLTMENYRATIVQSIGENIQVKRLSSVEKSPDSSMATYLHMGGKIFTLVEIQGQSQQEPLAKELAMHVAAEAPDYLSPKDVPETIVEQEKEIARNQIKNKPEHIVNKIIEGKVQNFYQQSCLTHQKYIKDGNLSVQQFLDQEGKKAGKDLTIARFVRWEA